MFRGQAFVVIQFDIRDSLIRGYRLFPKTQLTTFTKIVSTSEKLLVQKCVKDCESLTLTCLSGFGLELIFNNDISAPRNAVCFKKSAQKIESVAWVTIFSRHNR